jgi:hypothetical protein
MNVELSKMDKDTDKQERRERIKEFGYNSEYERGKAGRSTWGEKVQEKEKWWRDSDVETRREKTQRKEGVECALRRERQSSTCGMDVAKWESERGKGTGRNIEWRWKGDRMDERDMEEEGKDREWKGWGILFIL